jgi:hypothetical protein
MRRILTLLLALVGFASGVLAQDQAMTADTRPTLLRALDGNWVMTGDVLGKPVTYDMVAVPSLQGAFTEMHMKDMQVPSKYEARVFIGVDPGSQFSIPYDSGPFRDTLIFHLQDRSWSLAIEASQPDGSWKHFARYKIRPK